MLLRMQGSRRVLQLVDLPGHPRLQVDALRRCTDARCVVFVLDAGAFMTQKAEAAGCAPVAALLSFGMVEHSAGCWLVHDFRAQAGRCFSACALLCVGTGRLASGMRMQAAAAARSECARSVPELVIAAHTRGSSGAQRHIESVHAGSCCKGATASARLQSHCRLRQNSTDVPPCLCRQLLQVLQALAARPRRPPPHAIVACNKSDLGVKAFSDAFITKQLEKELCAAAPAAEWS